MKPQCKQTKNVIAFSTAENTETMFKDIVELSMNHIVGFISTHIVSWQLDTSSVNNHNVEYFERVHF